jgi:PAS domain S-box-containing protein
MEDRKTPLQMLYASGNLSKVGSCGLTTYDGIDEKRARRNTREQKRAAKINEQIETLKALLSDANYPMKTTSKFHILYSCEKYIKELVDKSYKLNSRREKASSSYRNDTSSDYDSNSSDYMTDTTSFKDEQTSCSSANDGKALQESFEGVFCTSEVPIAIASADGQILRTNEKFCSATGYTSEELRALTIFSLAHAQFRKQMFEAVGASIVSVLSSKEVSANPRIVPIQVHIVDYQSATSFLSSSCRDFKTLLSSKVGLNF